MNNAKLIAALEGATGPDRELNKLLVPFVGLRLVEEGHPLGPCCYDQNGHGVPLPNFTASIDAALTLVPEGWGFMSLGADPYEEEAFCVTIYERRHWNRHREWPEGSITTGYSLATPALAICIAALRAQGGDKP